MNAPDSSRHPCFSRGAHQEFARAHLPVAPRCNISCGFCDRRYSCVNESRPGVTAEVMSPETALDYLENAAIRLPKLSVAGIAGPGDPLANPDETFETLALVRRAFPRLMTCVSTNGLALPASAHELARLGVSHVTVTMNAATAATAEKIYAGTDPAELLAAQRLGISLIKKLGLAVKINTVVISGVNDAEISAIAKKGAGLGADLMNCIALIPVPGTRLASAAPPDAQKMNALRLEAGAFIKQMRHCARCRADAAGLLDSSAKLSDFRGSGYQLPPI